MKRILSIILSITMLLSMATVAFADGVDGPMQKAKIKVAISADFKPFEYYDENGKLTGFDVDLMNCIGEKIGFDIEFVDMSFDKLIPAVVNEEVACAISAITVTEERDSIIDYSREYLKTYNITFDENGKRSTKYGEQYAIVFKEGLSGSPYEDLTEPTMDETVYILIDEALRELSNDRTVTKLIEKYELNKPLDESAINVEYSAIIGGGDPGAETVKKYTFEELTNISAENVVQIAINYNEGERVPATTTESIMIEKIVEDFKDVQFWLDDSAGGGAGGWLYFINFYMKDGTYIQYGTRIHIDKTTYKACDYEDSLKKMAYYHNLIQNEDSEPKTSATSIPASEWAWADIDKAKALNIINYGGNYNFPGAITREDFCELIYNYCYNVAKQVGIATGENPFTDTTNSNIIRLQKMGIVYGKSETEFAPNDLLTREEAATILNRLINVVHPDLASTELYFEFADSEQISDWSMSAIQRICNMGIMKGVGNNNFAPQDNYTTEQAIVTLVRVYANSGVSKNVIGGADGATDIVVSSDAEYVLKVIDKDGNIILNNNDILSCEVRWMPRPEDGPSAGVVTGIALELKLTEKARANFKEATKRISEDPNGECYVKVLVDGIEIARPTVAGEIDSDEILVSGSNGEYETFKGYADKINAAIK